MNEPLNPLKGTEATSLGVCTDQFPLTNAHQIPGPSPL
jgi:hypothetical protein